jgi:hypothetical protein
MPEEIVKLVVERFNEGNCISWKCEEVTTPKECEAVIKSETWASGSRFYEGTYEPNARDGKPAPDRCYVRLSDMTLFWNNRETPQYATKYREKICKCQSGLTRSLSTEMLQNTIRSPTREPKMRVDPLLPEIKSKIPNCETYHMYPNVDFQDSNNIDEPSLNIMLSPHVSLGVKFTPRRDMFITAARLRAAFVKGTNTWFQLSNSKDGRDVIIGLSLAVEGKGVGNAKHPGMSDYIGKFETVHHLIAGKTYVVSYLLDRTNFYRMSSLWTAVYEIDKPWNTEFASDMHLISTNLPWISVSGDAIFPNVEDDILPQLDLCE